MKIIRVLLPLIIALAVGVFGTEWIATQKQYDFGEVLVRIGGYDYSTGLPQTVILLVLLLLLLWLLWSVVSIPYKAWRSYRQKKALSQLVEGLHQAELGYLQRAEHALESASHVASMTTVTLAHAVRIADQQGDSAQAESLLKRLSRADELTYALVQGKRLLKQGQAFQGLDILGHISVARLPPRGLYLYCQLLDQAGRAAEAFDALNQLRQQAIFPETRIDTLERTLAEHALKQAGSLEHILQFWDGLLPVPLQSHPQLIVIFAERCCAFAHPLPALQSLEKALEQKRTPEVLHAYATLRLGEHQRRYDFLSKHLALHIDDADLLLARATVAYADLRDAAAVEDVTVSLTKHDTNHDAWELLGEALFRSGDFAHAAQCFQNAKQCVHKRPLAFRLADILATPTTPVPPSDAPATQ